MCWFLDLLNELHYTFLPEGSSSFRILKKCPRILQLYSSSLKKKKGKKMSLYMSEQMKSTVSSFLPPIFPCVGSQHWSNLILDLRDQHLGQHDASNLEDRGSHFKLQSTLLCVQPAPCIPESLWTTAVVLFWHRGETVLPPTKNKAVLHHWNKLHHDFDGILSRLSDLPCRKNPYIHTKPFSVNSTSINYGLGN